MIVSCCTIFDSRSRQYQSVIEETKKQKSKWVIDRKFLKKKTLEMLLKIDAWDQFKQKFICWYLQFTT